MAVSLIEESQISIVRNTSENMAVPDISIISGISIMINDEGGITFWFL